MSEGEVKIFKRLNRLRRKAGADPNDTRPGFIDVNSVERAQKSIDLGALGYKAEVQAVLGQIDVAWQDIAEATDDRASALGIETLYHQSHIAKDVAETYEHTLMAFFARSLRDFCKTFDRNNHAHHVIIKAHRDVMMVAHKSGLKDYASPEAEELKRVLERAIQKHS